MGSGRNYSLLTSGEIAKARTELTIASDRLDCNPEDMQQMRSEVLNVLTKYLRLDETVFEIRMDFVYEINRGKWDVKTIQIK